MSSNAPRAGARARWLPRGRTVRAAGVAGGSALLVATMAVGYGMHRASQARSMLGQARARLDAPFVEAPTLDRLQASTARSLLERAAALGVDDEEVRGLSHYASALEDLQRGDLVLAEGELAVALTHLGPTAQLHVLAAALSRARRLDDEARLELRRALEMSPDAPRARLIAADLALDHEDGAEAQAQLEWLAAHEPESGVVWNRLGLARELLGDRPGAEAAFVRAGELDRLGHDPWLNLGRLLRDTGRTDASLAAFDTAVRRAPADPDAHLGRGLARAAVEDVAGAQADFERAAELAPNDAEPLLALGDLLRDHGQVERAIESYRRALDREDADAASWLKLGNALGLLERWAPAEAAFRQATARAPGLAPARNGLGASLMHLGRGAEARRELEQAAELDGRDPNPLMNLALLCEREGDVEAARAAWERVLLRAPGSAIAAAHLARP